MPPKISFDQPHTYRICVQGHLGDQWADYFEGMQIKPVVDPGGNPFTYLSGSLADQAALQGVLQKLYNLGFSLILAEKVGENGESPTL